jgi:hypothetical protein
MSEAHYNKESVDLRRVPNPLPADHVERPGDFSWGAEYEGKRCLYICLPGDARMDAIRVQRGAPGGDRVWGWDGNEEKPTITPSIHSVGSWHGWLRAGRLESC